MQFDELNTAVREFCEHRDWAQYHTPKDLAIGLTTEAGELLELFRFKDREEQTALLADAEQRDQVEAELADIRALPCQRLSGSNGGYRTGRPVQIRCHNDG